MELKDLIQQIKNLVESTSDTKTVYGDPIEKNGSTIIPVSKVSYSGGGGIGKGTGKNELGDDAEGEGGGYGISSSIKPIGFIKMNDGKSEFEPIVDINQLLKHIFFFATIGLLIFFRFIIKLKKKRK